MELQSIDAFMAIGAHCDDVDLRCGGTFARLVREGKRGRYVVAVENAYVGAHYSVRDSREALATRRAESTTASAILGADRLEWLTLKSFYFSTPEAGSRVYASFDTVEVLCEELKDVILDGLPPVATADHFPRCCERLRRLVEDFAPQVIFTHSPDDRHPDHYSLSRFVEFIVGQLNHEGRNIELCFWEPGSGGPIVEYRPDFFVELSQDDVAAKQKAIDCYISQFPKGLVATFAADRARAYGKLVGVEYAEAFRKCPCPRQDPWKGECDFLRRLARGTEATEIYRY